MKIVALDSENVKRLRAVHIEPDGSLVVIGGRNEQGKTSVLDSIAYALGGKELIPKRPLREGAESGRVRVQLDDPGLVVTRTFTKEGGGTLRVENAEGAAYRSPQRMLNELVGALTFDPLDFANAKPREQLDMLRQVVGLDFSEHDRERQAAYDARREVNREVKRLEGAVQSMPHHEDAPEEEVSASALAEELQAAEESEAAVGRLEGEVRQGEADFQEVGQKIEELEERLRLAKAKQEQIAASVRDSKARLKAARASVTPSEPIRERLRAVDEHNRKHRENADRAARKAELEERRGESKKLTEQIEALDAEKERKLAETPFPVEGLGFGEEGVVFKGVPFEQASGAERIQVSVAMGLALNPKCRVLLIRDGSLLDEEHLRLVAELADRNDAQVWVEKVASDASQCAVLIEDGSVASPEGSSQ